MKLVVEVWLQKCFHHRRLLPKHRRALQLFQNYRQM